MWWYFLIGVGVMALMGMAGILIYKAATARVVRQVPSPYGMIDLPPDSELREGRDAHPQRCRCDEPQSDGGICLGCGGYIFNEIMESNDD